PDYRKTVGQEARGRIVVRGAAVIELHPLDAATVSGYLLKDVGGPGAQTRWGPVLALLGTAAPVGQALVTPLMVGLARMIYSPRYDERAADLRDPAELCALPNLAAVESHLFDAFIPAAYRPRPGDWWDARHAEAWLVFLACHLQRTVMT